jgi:hypothetical protein
MRSDNDDDLEAAVATVLGHQLKEKLQRLGYDIPDAELRNHCQIAVYGLLKGLGMRNWLMESGALKAPVLYTVGID